MSTRVINLHPEAPAKPAVGARCNGCGWCCAAEPCPLGMLISMRRQGACRALRWDAENRRYDCGALARAAHLGPWPQRLVARWIAAGAGCDATLERVDELG
jgi:hypothetical protein